MGKGEKIDGGDKHSRVHHFQNATRTKLASRCPVVILVVSKANLGRDPISPKMVVRTASWTCGAAVAVNLEMTSLGEILETTCM